MKYALATIVLVLSTVLLWTPAHGIPRAAPDLLSAAAEFGPVQAAAPPATTTRTQPQEVGLRGPSRAPARTRVQLTCSLRTYGTSAEPQGAFILRLGRKGVTYWKSSPRRVPPLTRDILTPRLPRGIYNARCTFDADPNSIFASTTSRNLQLTVRRKAA